MRLSAKALSSAAPNPTIPHERRAPIAAISGGSRFRAHGAAAKAALKKNGWARQRWLHPAVRCDGGGADTKHRQGRSSLYRRLHQTGMRTSHLLALRVAGKGSSLRFGCRIPQLRYSRTMRRRYGAVAGAGGYSAMSFSNPRKQSISRLSGSSSSSSVSNGGCRGRRV